MARGKDSPPVLDPKNPEDASLVEAAKRIFAEDMAETPESETHTPDLSSVPEIETNDGKLFHTDYGIFSTSHSLASALVAFQARMTNIPKSRTVSVKTKTGGSYTFDYAPHEVILAAIRKPLAECGLAVSQQLSNVKGIPALNTMLIHTSGERIESSFPLEAVSGMSAQEVGSLITYMRRYALSAILGLATENDDDGNAASGNEIAQQADRPINITSSNQSGIQVGGRSTNVTDAQLREIARLARTLKLGDALGIFAEEVTHRQVPAYNEETAKETMLAFMRTMTFDEASTLIGKLNLVLNHKQKA